MSFLMDPASLEVTDLARADVWLPVLDPRGRAVVYWSGTLVSDDGRTWALGTGDLVLDGWSDEVEAPDASVGPEESASPQTTAPGPVGTPTILVEGDKATFEASFGPVGDHLAIWVGEAVDDEVGRLHLVVIDPETATVSNDSPLVGARALRRFAIDSGRLAWVTPSGQDGQDSAVKVLGWKGDDFGEIEPQSGSDLYIVP